MQIAAAVHGTTSKPVYMSSTHGLWPNVHCPVEQQHTPCRTLLLEAKHKAGGWVASWNSQLLPTSVLWEK